MNNNSSSGGSVVVVVGPNVITGGNVSTGGTIIVQSGTGTNLVPAQWITHTIAINASCAGDTTSSPKPKDDRDGCDCAKCKDFYPYAEPNQENGTLICYRCRHGW